MRVNTWPCSHPCAIFKSECDKIRVCVWVCEYTGSDYRIIIYYYSFFNRVCWAEAHLFIIYLDVVLLHCLLPAPLRRTSFALALHDGKTEKAEKSVTKKCTAKKTDVKKNHQGWNRVHGKSKRDTWSDPWPGCDMIHTIDVLDLAIISWENFCGRFQSNEKSHLTGSQ